MSGAANIAARATAAKPFRPTPAIPASPPLRVSMSSATGPAKDAVDGAMAWVGRPADGRDGAYDR
jgi:hypothetical protein